MILDSGSDVDEVLETFGGSDFLNSFITANIVLAFFIIGDTCLKIGIAWFTRFRVLVVPLIMELKFILLNKPEAELVGIE